MVSKLSKETQVALECMLRETQKEHPKAFWCSWPIVGVSRFSAAAWTLHAADGQAVVIGDARPDEHCALLTRAAQETEAYDRAKASGRLKACLYCDKLHDERLACPEYVAHDAPRGARSRAAQRHAEYLAKRKVEQDTHADVNAFIDTIRDREAKREALMTEMQNAMRFELGKSYLPDSRRQEASAEWSRRVREGVKALKPALQVCVQPELEEWE